MAQMVIICLLMVFVLGIEFAIYGVGFQKLFRLELAGYETVLAGFFAYFGLFQAAALPMILLQRPFHELMWLWVAVSIALNCLILATAKEILFGWLRGMGAAIRRMGGALFFIALLLLGFTCYFQWAQHYLGWDTSFYIGTVNTTLHTDTMYVYDGNSGLLASTLPFRYALSAFYMHSALLCRVGGVSAMMAQKCVMGTICVGMHGAILFALGRRLFPRKEKAALLFVCVVLLLNYGLNTIYASSSFLLVRAYEAKGFCANVVIPAVFYGIFCVWADAGKREPWYLLFAVGFASVPVSMSSLLIVPVMIGMAALVECVLQKDWKVLGRGVLCALPNGAYLLAYFLYAQGFLRIMIH